MLRSLQVANYLTGNSLVIAINCAAGLSIFGVLNPFGWYCCVYYAGTLIGALMGGYVGDKMGRIKCVVVGCIIALFGAALQTAALNVPWMICSRIITGIGTGHLNAIVPVWSAETSHHTSRGMFIAMEFTLNIFGVVIAYWIAFGLNTYEGSFRWRFPIGFQTVPLLVLCLLINIFPESPRWLVKKGRTEEALHILGALRGNGNVGHPDVIREYEEIKETLLLEEKQGGEPNYWAMLFKYVRRIQYPTSRVHLSIWLQIIQELTGIGVITVYTPETFAQSGFSERIHPNFCPVVIIYIVGQGIALIMVAVLTKPDIMAHNPTVEIYPLRMRARGGAWSVVGWSIGNAVVMEITPPMLAGIGWATFILFAALAIPIVWALYPETMGKTLEELDGIDPNDPLATIEQTEEIKTA
ncbi:hypothetical protein INT45_008613 [Circinella minor]|uniref:Major facilitator superfamily (MFS) profile domain-containing protein n=1 Tax=Circinella minor TaxID=1195481 RepID=A0A8H7VJE1_9FUNG|nr:hypothetical protein INT45_008613 [Circinella minor]